MARVQVHRQVLAVIDTKIAFEQEQMRYVPEGIALLESPAGFLFVNEEGILTFPQVAVERGERVAHALCRKLWEAARIRGDDVTVRKFCFAAKSSTAHVDCGGLMMGESWYYFHLRCAFVPSIWMGPWKRGHEWISHEYAPALILAARSRGEHMCDKCDSMLFSLFTALRA